MKTTSIKTRESNFELLRVISMLMIMFTHFLSYSDLQYTSLLSANRIVSLLLNIGGKLGADIFIIISGYFLINSNKIKIERVLRISGCAVFYSVTTYFIGFLIGKPFSFIEMIKSFLPISYEHWWFISAYFVLYLIHPLLNKLLKSIDRRTHIRAIILMFVMWSVLPTFLFSQYQSNNLLLFIFLYFIAGYIRIYSEEIKISSGKCLKLFSISALTAFVLAFILLAMTTKWSSIGKYITHFYKLSSVFIVFCAVMLFLAFKNIKIENNKFINTISSATLGVYLIHDSNYIRTPMWSLFGKLGFSAESGLFVIQMLVFVLFVYAVCTAIDLVRINTIEILFMKLMKKPINAISNKYKNSKISKYI